MASVDERGREPLQLSATALLDALRPLRRAVAVADVRAGVAALQARVAAGELRAASEDDSVVAFSAGQLEAELDQIAQALSVERAIYYVERLVKGISEVRTGAINDINLNRWKAYDDILTDSLWLVERRDSTGAHTAGYWGNFIPQIPHQLMRRYTRRSDWVLDAFAGSGTTLIEGQRLGRNTLGIELQERVAEDARRLIAAEPNEHGVVAEVVTGDNSAVDYHSLLARHGRRSVQLLILHPPYHDIIKFSDDPRDLSNAPSVPDFLERIGRTVERAAGVLERGRYLALVIGDTYRDGEWVPLGFQTMQAVLERGFTLKSIVVKNFEQTAGKRSQQELWRYRALVGGFYIFKHEYIFICKKR
jgi:hypothetical protein